MQVPQRQRGAILVVSLVMLLVLTVLGISTMNTASLELNMAGNKSFYERAFQIAETGIDETVQGLNNGTPAPPPINPGACPPMPALADRSGDLGDNARLALDICFIGDIPDLTGGSSLGKIRQFHYQNRSRGVIQGSGAQSFHHQGLFLRGPDGL